MPSVLSISLSPSAPTYDPSFSAFIAAISEGYIGSELCFDYFSMGSVLRNLVIAEEESEDQPVVSTTEREALVYHPHHNLTDRDIDQFLIIARFVCLRFVPMFGNRRGEGGGGRRTGRGSRV